MSDSTPSSSKLEAITFQRLHPKAYLERFLAEGIRPDGRNDIGWRDVSVNAGSISTAHGSALVRIGNTTIVCGVKAEISEPDLDRPEHGFIVTNLDLPAICSPKFKPGPPGEEAQVLSDRLHDILLSSDVISPTSLCIERAKAVWVLYIDATCINHDGNALDAALLAVVAALSNTKLPHATYTPESSTPVTVSRTVSSPLTLNTTHLPLSFSFGLFETHLLADPTAFEEPLLTSSLEVVVYSDGDVGEVSQTGGIRGGGRDIMVECIQEAKKRRIALGKILNAATGV